MSISTNTIHQIIQIILKLMEQHVNTQIIQENLLKKVINEAYKIS